MAAELHSLIEAFRQQGLDQAAFCLEQLKEELVAQGLPPTLSLKCLDRRSNLFGGTFATPEERDIANRVRGHRLDDWAPGLANSPRRTYEIDTLGLTSRQRNALLHANITTFAEVSFFVKYGLLQNVYSIGQISSEAVEEKLRRTAVRRDQVEGQR